MSIEVLVCGLSDIYIPSIIFISSLLLLLLLLILLILFIGVGVYISRVEEGSVAERAGLRPGDTILEVNGTPFRAVTHEEALKVFLNTYLSKNDCKLQGRIE